MQHRNTFGFNQQLNYMQMFPPPQHKVKIEKFSSGVLRQAEQELKF